jgi:hypothetical protein
MEYRGYSKRLLSIIHEIRTYSVITRYRDQSKETSTVVGSKGLSVISRLESGVFPPQKSPC